jgi:hypothetical protein
MVADFNNLSEYHAAFSENRPMNTQLSSFGMGKLFVQVLSCPNSGLVTNFEMVAKESGLTQLWPVPTKGLSKGFVRFPTKRILTDYDAELLSDECIEIFKITTQYPYIGKHLM